MKKGKLFIVPTPIGNLGDMTFRAVEILKNVKVIGAEDTRTSAKLLKHYNITTTLFSYHKFNERSRINEILEHLNKGEDIALISDAGTPGISDPAEILIKEAIKAEIQIEALPGATAFLPALVASGLDCSRFHFVGFLPVGEKERNLLLQDIKNLKSTLIFYEAPHRLLKTLARLKNNLGNRRIVLARELTKIHETYLRTTLDEILEKPQQITIKGEFVLLLEGWKSREMTDSEIRDEIKCQLGNGLSIKNAVHEIAEKFDLPRNRVYKLALK